MATKVADKQKKPTIASLQSDLTIEKELIKELRAQRQAVEKELWQLREAHEIKFADLEKERATQSSLNRELLAQIEVYMKSAQTQQRITDELKDELGTCQENSHRIIEDLKIENETLKEAKLKLTGVKKVLMEIIEKHADFS